MSSSQYKIEQLPWLPRLSNDFNEKISCLAQEKNNIQAMAIQDLAIQFLGLNQMNKLAKLLNSFKKTDFDMSPLVEFKLGIVSNATVDFIKPCLEASALRYGIALEVITTDFGQLMQEALNPESKINQARPDAILISIDYKGLPFSIDGQKSSLGYSHVRAIDFISQVIEGFNINCGSPCILQTIPTPKEVLFGSMDYVLQGALRHETTCFNRTLVTNEQIIKGNYIFDVDWLASSIGLQNWNDDAQWFHAKLAFAQHCLPVYADFAARIIGAIRGKTKKCLVLDLDNTLWGGVIGDDGINNIVIGQGNSVGEAYLGIQTMAKKLRDRGVILAVCSKNEESTALEPFRNHPGMILREEDIAVFKANWKDKASNLEEIAQELNIGLDSLVLLDDNPYERAQVRDALPMVAVPEVGDNPVHFPVLLSMAGYFESVSFTEEDKLRADQYQANVQRSKLSAQTKNIDDFLSSLEMKMSIRPFDTIGRKRITQLINKTNQFNLTTKRYTEKEVAEFEDSNDYLSLQIGLKDKFGDNGMISVLIAHKGKDVLFIDTWLMSCRVLKRGVEEAICNYLVDYAKQNNFSVIRGQYIPSERNGIVKDLYQKLGFELNEKKDKDDIQTWDLTIEEFQSFNSPIEIKQ